MAESKLNVDVVEEKTNKDDELKEITDLSACFDKSSLVDAITNDNGQIDQLSKDMFQKTADYLQGELSGTLDDYKLLEEMNRVTINKYSDMKQIAVNVSKSLKDLNDKYKSLQPYLEQIEQIEASALKLEQAAYKLDAYSKRLETKFKQLEKK